jgi:hypothetical protein
MGNPAVVDAVDRAVYWAVAARGTVSGPMFGALNQAVSRDVNQAVCWAVDADPPMWRSNST